MSSNHTSTVTCPFCLRRHRHPMDAAGHCSHEHAVRAARPEASAPPMVGPRAEDVLDFIKEFVGENGFSPSLREIAGGVGLKSTGTVHHHLQQLVERGFIRRLPGAVRTIQILDDQICPTCGRPREEVNTHDGIEPEHDDRALQPLA